MNNDNRVTINNSNCSTNINTSTNTNTNVNTNVNTNMSTKKVHAAALEPPIAATAKVPVLPISSFLSSASATTPSPSATDNGCIRETVSDGES